MLRLLFIYILFTNIGYPQSDTATERKFYKNGKPKYVVYKHGTDTIELIRFYRNGRMRDSIWLYTPGKKEFPFGTEREYFPDGKLASTTIYGKGFGEHRAWYFNNKGTLLAEVNRPAGVSVFYTNKGKIRQVLDENKNEQVFVPLPYRGRQHLISSGSIVRVKSRKANLISGKRKVTLSSGALISLVMNADTLHHCKVEGFSRDSVLLSKFEYDLSSGPGKLLFDSTFSVSKNKLSVLFYAKHNTHKRAQGGKISLIAGISMMCLPAVLIPLAPRALFAPAGPLLIVAVPVTAACLGIGFPLYLLSKHLYRTMVPVKYDMKEWSFKP